MRKEIVKVSGQIYYNRTEKETNEAVSTGKVGVGDVCDRVKPGRPYG